MAWLLVAEMLVTSYLDIDVIMHHTCVINFETTARLNRIELFSKLPYCVCHKLILYRNVLFPVSAESASVLVAHRRTYRHSLL